MKPVVRSYTKYYYYQNIEKKKRKINTTMKYLLFCKIFLEQLSSLWTDTTNAFYINDPSRSGG